jgi:hypothetical protein
VQTRRSGFIVRREASGRRTLADFMQEPKSLVYGKQAHSYAKQAVPRIFFRP